MPASSMISGSERETSGRPRQRRLVSEASITLRDRSNTVRRWLPLLAVAGVVFLLLWPVVVGDYTFFYRDLYRQHMGTARLLRSGELPFGLLWDPLLNGGQPLLANPNRFLLYPSRLLYPTLAPLSALNWEITLHLLLGGLGAAFLSRRLGAGGAGVAVAGIAYSTGGLSISLTNHLGRLLAYHWLPWIVLAAYAVCGEDASKTRRGRAVLPVLLAVQWLTGAAELAAMAALMVVVGAMTWTPSNQRHVPLVAWAVALVVLGVGLAAVQVIPSAEMVMRSERPLQASTEASLVWSLNPLRTPELVVPGFCGPVDVADSSSRYWGARLVDFGFPYLLSLYLGASVMLLAVIGWIHARTHPRWRSLQWWLAGLVAVGLVVAFGRHLPIVGGLLAHLPGIDLLRFPVKALLLTGLPIALLAGRGADFLLSADRAELQRIWRIGAVIAGVTLLQAVVVWSGLARPLAALVFGEGAPAIDGLSVSFGHAALAIAGIAVVAFAGAHFSVATRGLLVTAIVAVDLVGAAERSLLIAPREAFSETPPMVETVRRLAGDGLFVRDLDPENVFVPLPVDRAWASAAWWNSVLDGSLAANWGVPMVYHSDAEVLAGRRVAELSRTARRLGWPERLKLYRVAAVELVMTPEQPPLEDFREVAAAVVSPELVYRLYRVAGRAPVVRWVPKEKEVQSGGAALEALTVDDFDPLEEVVREAGGDRTRVARPSLLQPTVVLWKGEITAPAPGLIVAAIPWHPDVLLEIDGTLVAAERLNYAYTGAPVAEGSHRVKIVFAPRAVLWGGVVSVISLVALCVLGAVLFSRRV